MQPANERRRIIQSRTTRLRLVSANGERLSMLDGSTWVVAGLSAMVSRSWKVGDEVVSGYDELHHYRTNTRLHADRVPDGRVGLRPDRRRIE